MTEFFTNFAPERKLRPISSLRAVYSGNGTLAATGLFMLLCMVPTALALSLDERVFNGINVWIKPLKFQFSLAVHLLTIAILLQLLPLSIRRGWQVTIISATAAMFTLFESGYITLQAARAVGSHYNTGTPIGAIMYPLMGIGAVALVVAAIWTGVLILRWGEGPKQFVVSAGLGLVLGGLLGGVTGAYMASQPMQHWVGGVLSDAGGLPIFGWARDGGDLRVAHFLGLHMMQMLPIFGAALWWAHYRAWKSAILSLSAIGVIITIGTFLQAVAGRPFF